LTQETSVLGTTLETESCEVCGSRTLRRAIDLGLHPMCDDLVPVGSDYVCKHYPIDILFCDTCRTAHQRFQISKRELFPTTYHYRSRHTVDVLNGMKDLVAATEATIGSLDSQMVLDIGCNDGSLLSFFAEKGAKTFGIEPTGAAADAAERGHTLINDFFCEEVAEQFVRKNGRPDVITFTNVFAHIEDLKGVIRALTIMAHEGTLIVIENHYLGAILDRKQFDTFYHEHPRTYSLTSFVHIAKSLAMQIVLAEFPKRYGGNIRVFLSAKPGAAAARERLAEVDALESGFSAGLDKLATQVAIWQTNKLAQINAEIAKHGPLAAKAFPGRAAIPVKMLNLTPQHISAAYEKPSSAKVGNYIPGTRIVIRSDNEFSPTAIGDAPLINLAWHITDEIQGYLRQRGFKGPIIDIIAPEDFLERK
jgi:2-polyprenyl-3-methyl-5-hydroxy-6-metoxy-1,4-benzoquinol methylase